MVGQGEFELELDGESVTRRYERGDVVLLPAGATRVDMLAGRARVHSRRMICRSWGTTPPTTVRGGSPTFSFDEPRASHLLQGLPTLIELRGAGDRSLVWLDVSSQMLMRETTTRSQGSAVMISRILDLLFVQVLRAWATGPDAQPGWLTGAMDPVIGEAITAIHANPRHQWTVERLAQKSNLSRSAFADRFARRAGRPPATYITHVRLASAADLLLDTPDPISVIASDVGYESEAAFSRAFSRRYGVPPSRWRRDIQQQ